MDPTVKKIRDLMDPQFNGSAVQVAPIRQPADTWLVVLKV
jgi:hypothetical protein